MTNEELDAMRTLMVERDAALKDAGSHVSPQALRAQHLELEALRSRCSSLETRVFLLSERNVHLEATLDRVRRILEDWRNMPRSWHPTPLLSLIEKAMGRA
jgi:hypothetical protein